MMSNIYGTMGQTRQRLGVLCLPVCAIGIASDPVLKDLPVELSENEVPHNVCEGQIQPNINSLGKKLHGYSLIVYPFMFCCFLALVDLRGDPNLDPTRSGR